MENQFIRTEMLLGVNSTELFQKSTVAIFGVGGVGSFTVEALARSGIGTFYLFDRDVVMLSNINRQLIATHATIGMNKVEAAKRRILEINPNAIIYTYFMFVDKVTIEEISFPNFDYIVDAIDTVTSKILLVEYAKRYKIPIICAMGAGNKLDPTQFEVTDIYKTSVCPLARVLRSEMKKRKVTSLKVVYSKEQPRIPLQLDQSTSSTRKVTPGSLAFVPSVCGLIIAGEVLKDILAKN